MAITGPNGSGKSNISDAILFVLGPKSSKAIRAGKLPDLIFDGGKSRRPADFTRVSLIFDNHDRLIPWDADTVKLTRTVKISASGEGYNSYFYVNDHRSSLGEFDELLSSARISAEGYNLVQQGDVTRIVEMGNLERRRVLDNMSGIARFDADIAKAEEERAETEENLDRISIIKKELEAQLEQLEEERAEARRYLDTKAELDLAKAQLAHKSLELARSEADSTEQQISSYESEISSLEEDRRRLLAESAAFEEEMKGWEAEMESRGGDEYRTLKDKRDELMVEAARRKDRAERAESDIAENDAMAAEAEEERQALDADEEEAKSDRAAAASAKEDAVKARDSLQERLEALRQEIDSRGGELARLQEELEGAEASIDEKREEQHALTLERGGTESRLEALERQRCSLEEDLETAKFEAQDAEWQIRELRASEGESARRAQELGETIRVLKQDEAKLSKDEEDLRQAVYRLEREYNALKAEKEAAENLQKGYNRAVAAVLEARDRGSIKGIHGTIAEMAEVEERFETAVAVAAGGRMQAIIVDDDQVASEAIAMLKRSKAGRATFLPLSKMQEGRPRAKAIMAAQRSLGYAIDLVSFDPAYRAAFWHVLGDTVVAEDLSSARSLMGGVRIVTLEGELIEAAGAMVGGSIAKQGMRFGSSAAGRLEKVAEELRRASEEAERAQSELRSLTERMRSMEEELREASSSTRDFEEEMGRLERKRDEARQRRDQAKERLESVKKEASAEESALAAKEEELRACSAKLEELRGDRDALKEEMLRLAPKEVQDQLDELQQSLINAERAVSDTSASLRETDSRLVSLAERRQENEREAARLNERGGQLREERDTAREEEAAIRTEMAAVKEIMRTMEEELRELREKRDDAYRKSVARSSEAGSVKDRIDTKRDFQTGLRLRLEQAMQRVAQLEKELEAFSVEVEPPLPSMDSIRARIRRHEASLEAMGNVNLRAIEDYEEKKARHARMLDEVDRLEAQRQELLALMDALNEEKKAVFDGVFKAVDANFREIYADLSGGGEAYLSLEDPQEPFQGGLMINAKPKNGKLLRLEALSGGEKSLTALAFIFALQEHQPSPFYLLDEVDMFLDSVNAEMVARRVKQSCAKAQFVQISLRKVTLGKADHLMGVTRQPNGVSKVIMQPEFPEVARGLEEAEGSA